MEDTQVEKTPLVGEPAMGDSPLVSKTTVFYLGIASLLSYSILLQSLPMLSEQLHDRMSSIFTVAWGMGAVIGLVLGYFLFRRMRTVVLLCLSLGCASLIGSSFPVALALGPDSSIIATCAIAISLGLSMSVCQLTGGSFTAGISAQHVTAYFIGQSVAGLIPLPLIEILKLIPLLQGQSQFRTDLICLTCSLSLASLLALVLIGIFVNAVTGREPVRVPRSTESIPSSIAHVYNKLEGLPLYVFLILFVTFSVYPAHVVAWKPESAFSLLSEQRYSALLLYLAICFDLLGLYLGLLGFSATKRTVKVDSLLRILIIPLFCISTVALFYFDNLSVRIILVAVLSLSGAFLFANALSIADSLVPEEEKETLGLIMSMAFALGLLCGSFFGYTLLVACDAFRTVLNA